MTISFVPSVFFCSQSIVGGGGIIGYISGYLSKQMNVGRLPTATQEARELEIGDECEHNRTNRIAYVLSPFASAVAVAIMQRQITFLCSDTPLLREARHIAVPHSDSRTESRHCVILHTKITCRYTYTMYAMVPQELSIS